MSTPERMNTLKRIRFRPKWRTLLCLTAPLLSFVFIKQEWAARLVAVNGVSLALTYLVFNYGLNPRSRILGTGGYFSVHKVSERTKKRMEYFWRGVIIVFGVGWLFFCVRTLIYDDIQFVRQGSPYAEHIDGRVTNNDTLFAMYFVLQGLLVKEDGQQPGNSYTAFLFPRIAHLGKTYRFTVAPKSGIILDFTEIPSEK